MKRSMIIGLFVCLSLGGAGAVSNQRDGQRDGQGLILISGARIIDGTGTAPRNGDLLIRGDRIEAVGSDIPRPAGARIMRADGMTILPGFFDLHTHLPYATASGVAGDWPKNLKSYLYCGVTSVVDFGTYPETFEPMRRLISTGIAAGPRISLAARMSTPGGHGAEGGRGDFFSLEVSTPDEARAAVQRVLPYRPDVIKVFTDGWRYGASPDMTSMNEETLSALVEEAHRHDLEVLTHTVTLERAKIAARAGVDVVAHGIGNAAIDDELIELFKSRGTTYAPTLAVYEPRGRDILSPLLATVLDPAVRSRVQPPLTEPRPASSRDTARDDAETNRRPDPPTPRQKRWSFLMENTANLQKSGARFGVGTDAGVTGTHHGWATLREMQLLVAGGLSPLEAIAAATGNAARVLEVDADRGTIAPGKLADLVIVEGDPSSRIGEIERIKHVFLGGKEVDREKLAADIASPDRTPIPAIKASELVDDFEKDRDGPWTGRSRLDTLWINSTDSGVDHSRMLFSRVRRPGTGSNGAGYALSITARMSGKERPFARVSIPLSRGAIEPADVRSFRGISFEARGDGDHRLIINTYFARDNTFFQSPFTASPEWRRIEIDFSTLKPSRERTTSIWRGDDVLLLTFEIAGAAGQFGWLELDNIRFY